MANQKLVEYIERQQEQNLPEEKVRESLLFAGWKKEDINEGFLEVSKRAVITSGTIQQDIKTLETLFSPLKIVESDLSNIVKEKPLFTFKKHKLSNWTIFLLVLFLVIIFAILYPYFPMETTFSIFTGFL